jgi:hypothetical protein
VTFVGEVMIKRNVLVTAVLAAGAALISAVPAHAGVIDGSADNANILSDIQALNTAINSDLQTVENNNANTRADGHKNNATGQHF